jgi:hypothetical protein
MISLIDQENQYFIAEATKSLSLVNPSEGVENDGLWAGCSTVDRHGRLCEQTLDLVPDHTMGIYPIFEVSDLSKDERFSNLEFVKEDPKFRFYAGTPLRTSNGINIGSLCVMDGKERKLNEEQTQFLSIVASSVMDYLEKSREGDERKRVMRMSKGLNLFLAGRGEIEPDEVTLNEPSHIPTLKPQTSDSSNSTKHRRLSWDGLGGTKDSNGSRNRKSRRDRPKDADATGYGSTFHRAANIMRDAMGMDGMFFLDSSAATVSDDARLGVQQPERPGLSPTIPSESASTVASVDFLDTATPSVTDSSDSDFKAAKDPQMDKSTLLNSANDDSETPEDISTGTFARSTDHAQAHADILGFATITKSSISGDASAPDDYQPMRQKFLRGLLNHYPKGKVFVLHENGPLSSSDEQSSREEIVGDDADEKLKRKKTRREKEMEELAKIFPSAAQVLLVPLFDPSSVRYLSGMFAWSKSDTRIFARESELSYMIAFGNTITAEVSRLKTVLADRAKGDFSKSFGRILRSR